MEDKIKIVELYKNRDIFITGGLGYMGKVLIEKLLRSCSDLKTIFVLIREKKDKSVEERLQHLLTSPLFDLLKSQNPKIFSKLIPIKGDVSLPGLGISVEDFELIKNVSIFFHSAATTRFFEPISKSIMVNVYGTYQVMELCEKLKNIKAVVHLSTTYSNMDQAVLEEKVYPPYADWKEMIELAKNSQDDILQETFVKKYLKYSHNHYSLTKHLGEQVINDYKNRLPIVLFRPSVVFSCISEPIPGWTDSISGPQLVFLGCGTGIIRQCWMNGENNCEVIAVDVAIKALIVAAYKKVLESKNELVVYNSSKKMPGLVIQSVSRQLVKSHPFEKCLWRPVFSTTTCKYNFMLSFLLFHLIPALFVDAILLIIGQKPVLYKIQMKVYKGFLGYGAFFLKDVDFRCDNTYQLDRFVLPEEFDTFAFNHFHTEDIRPYQIMTIKKIKKYILNEPEESTDGAKFRAKMFYVLDIICKSIFYFYLIRWLHRLNIIAYIFGN